MGIKVEPPVAVVEDSAPPATPLQTPNPLNPPQSTESDKTPPIVLASPLSSGLNVPSAGHHSPSSPSRSHLAPSPPTQRDDEMELEIAAAACVVTGGSDVEPGTHNLIDIADTMDADQALTSERAILINSSSDSDEDSSSSSDTEDRKPARRRSPPRRKYDTRLTTKGKPPTDLEQHYIDHPEAIDLLPAYQGDDAFVVSDTEGLASDDSDDEGPGQISSLYWLSSQPEKRAREITRKAKLEELKLARQNKSKPRRLVIESYDDADPMNVDDEVLPILWGTDLQDEESTRGRGDPASRKAKAPRTSDTGIYHAITPPPPKRVKRIQMDIDEVGIPIRPPSQSSQFKGPVSSIHRSTPGPSRPKAQPSPKASPKDSAPQYTSAYSLPPSRLQIDSSQSSQFKGPVSSIHRTTPGPSRPKARPSPKVSPKDSAPQYTSAPFAFDGGNDDAFGTPRAGPLGRASQALPFRQKPPVSTTNELLRVKNETVLELSATIAEEFQKLYAVPIHVGKLEIKSGYRLLPDYKLSEVLQDFSQVKAIVTASKISAHDIYVQHMRSTGGTHNGRLLAALGKVDAKRWLAANGMALTGADITALKKVLKFVRLDRLDLSNNALGDAQSAQIASMLDTQHQLLSLSLSCLAISARGLGTMAQTLPKLKELTELDLSYICRPKEACLGVVLEAVGSLTNLKRLNLRNTGLTSAVVESILNPSQIGGGAGKHKWAGLTELKQIILSHNPLGDTGIEALFTILLQHNTRERQPLKTLDVACCEIQGQSPTIGHKMRSILENATLRLAKVNLSENALSGALVAAIFSALPSAHLTSLDLSLCNITHTIATESISSFLWVRSPLVDLSLAGNPDIGSIGCLGLASTLGQLAEPSNLRSLDLSACEIRLSGCLALIAAISRHHSTHLPSLDRLDLAVNSIGLSQLHNDLSLAVALREALNALPPSLTELNLSMNHELDSYSRVAPTRSPPQR